jgi:hypothetical protein
MSFENQSTETPGGSSGLGRRLRAALAQVQARGEKALERGRAQAREKVPQVREALGRALARARARATRRE